MLTVQIGLTKDCFAWSDDPLWRKKVNKAVQLYEAGDKKAAARVTRE